MPAGTILVPKLKKVYIEITNRCNLACSFCPRPLRPLANMAPALFASALEQIRPCTGHVCLHVLGEPLLHPDLGVLLDLCQKQKLRVNLTTNGTLLPARHELLLSKPALRQINISLHSMPGNLGDQRQENYLNGVLSFIRAAASRADLFISLRAWNSAGQGDTSPELSRLSSFLGLQEELVDAVTPGHGITLAPRLFLSIAKPFAWPHAAAPDLGDRGFCHGLRTHAAILVDGTVVPCCLDAHPDIPLGNISSRPFDEIINSERAIRMKQGFRDRRLVEPLCRRCSFRQAFDLKPAGKPAAVL